MDLLLLYLALPADAPLDACDNDNRVRVWVHGQVMRALRHCGAVGAQLIGVRGTGDAFVLTADRGVPERVIQWMGSWIYDTYKVYICNNVDDTAQFTRRLAIAEKGRRQLRQDTMLGKNHNHVITTTSATFSSRCYGSLWGKS